VWKTNDTLSQLRGETVSGAGRYRCRALATQRRLVPSFCKMAIFERFHRHTCSPAVMLEPRTRYLLRKLGQAGPHSERGARDGVALTATLLARVSASGAPLGAGRRARFSLEFDVLSHYPVRLRVRAGRIAYAMCFSYQP
jgi:hypothetical protein